MLRAAKLIAIVVGSEGWLSNKGIEVSKTRGSYTQKKNVPQAGRGGKASRGRLTVGAPGSDIVRNLPPGICYFLLLPFF